MFRSSSNLRYFLLSGPVPLTSFRILKSHHLDWRRFRLGFFALAVSHAVSFEFADEQLTEFLSCTPAKADARILAEATATNLPWEVTGKAFEMDYRCRLTLLNGSDDDRLRGPFDGGDQIVAAYPVLQGYSTPVTRIGWRIESTRVSIETTHTYPEENRVIRSESVFQVAEDKESRP